MTNINELGYIPIVNEFCSINFFDKLYLTFIEPLLGASRYFMHFMCSKSLYLQKKQHYVIATHMIFSK